MQSPPISQAEIAARISSHLDELLDYGDRQSRLHRIKGWKALSSRALSRQCLTLTISVKVRKKPGRAYAPRREPNGPRG
jgi:hypothetical protein